MSEPDIPGKDQYSFEGLPHTTRLGGIKHKRWHQKFIARFLSNLPTQCSVVEIGPGRGDFARECQRRGWNYTGIEVSQKFLEVLNEMDLRVIESRVPPIPLPDDSTDLVHADQMIEHFCTVAQFTEFLREAKRVLKTGGILSLSCPNYQTMGTIFYDSDYTHCLPFTKNNLQRACLDYGFKINECAHYINLFLGRGLLYHFFRYVLIACIKAANVALISEIIDNIPATKDLRNRINKTLLDNVYIQAENQPCGTGA